MRHFWYTRYHISLLQSCCIAECLRSFSPRLAVQIYLSSDDCQLTLLVSINPHQLYSYMECHVILRAFPTSPCNTCTVSLQNKQYTTIVPHTFIHCHLLNITIIGQISTYLRHLRWRLHSSYILFSGSSLILCT